VELNGQEPILAGSLVFTTWQALTLKGYIFFRSVDKTICNHKGFFHSNDKTLYNQPVFPQLIQPNEVCFAQYYTFVKDVPIEVRCIK
jgi:hypothetical protein